MTVRVSIAIAALAPAIITSDYPFLPGVSGTFSHGAAWKRQVFLTSTNREERLFQSRAKKRLDDWSDFQEHCSFELAMIELPLAS